MIEHALAAGDVQISGCRDVARRVRESASPDRRTLRPVEVEPGLFPG